MGGRLGLDFRLFREADACFYLWAYDFGLGLFSGWASVVFIFGLD